MKLEDINIRDPFIFYENEKYYLSGTTGGVAMNNGSALVMYISEDMKQFEANYIKLEQHSLASYTDIWAPELHKYQNKYYLIVSVYRNDLGRGSIIFVSDNIFSTFSLLTGKYITPFGWGCLDATIFVYKCKPYLCFSNEWTTPITKDGDGALFICGMKEDLTELVGTPQKIIGGKQFEFSIEIKQGSKRGYVAEGPYLYEEDGQIILLWSTFTKGGYTIVKSISKSGVFGKYTFDKILFEHDGGHCMCFFDKNGDRWLVLHQPNSLLDERVKMYRIGESI